MGLQPVPAHHLGPLPQLQLEDLGAFLQHHVRARIVGPPAMCPHTPALHVDVGGPLQSWCGGCLSIGPLGCRDDCRWHWRVCWRASGRAGAGVHVGRGGNWNPQGNCCCCSAWALYEFLSPSLPPVGILVVTRGAFFIRVLYHCCCVFILCVSTV